MKKYILFILIMLSFMYSKVFALDFQTKELLDYESSQIIKTVATNDGNYLSFGRFPVESHLQNATSPGVVKYDENGSVIWLMVIEEYDIFSSVLDVYEDNDGTFYLVGYAFDPSDGFIAAVDKNGNLLWNKTTDVDTAFSINGQLYDVEKHNGKLYTVGSEGQKGVFNIFNLNGELEKHIKYETSVFNSISNIFFLDDDYLLVGTCYSNGDSTSDLDMCVARYNVNSEQIWHKSFGRDYDETIVGTPLFSENEIELFVGHRNNYSSIYSYSMVQFNIENGQYSSVELGGLSDFDVVDIKRTSNGFIFSHYISNSSTGEMSGYITALDESYNVIEDSTIEIPNVFFAIITPVNNSFNTFFISGYSKDSSYKFYSKTYELKINNEIIKNPTYNGDYTVEIVDGKGVITVQPDQGFELYKIVVKDYNGDNVAFTAENGKYYFELSSDVNVSVMFRKIDSNFGYNVMKKTWMNQSLFIDIDDIDFGVTFRDVERIDSNSVVSYYINMDENSNMLFVLSLVNNDGLEYKKISSRSDYILDVVYLDGYIYVYCILDVERDSERFAVVKYDLDLNVIKEVKIDNYYNDITEYRILSFLYNMDLFKVHDGNLYIPSGDGVLIYNANLDLVESRSFSQELCSVYEHYCYYIDGDSNDFRVLGYDSNNNYNVYSGVSNVDDKYKSFVVLIDQSGNTLLEKSLDKYEGIISVVLFKDYVIGIGSFKESMNNTEIFIMDYQGNVLQTMNDAYAYFSLRVTDNGVVTYAFDYSNEIKGLCSNDGVCVRISNYFYSLFSDVKVTGKYSNYVEVPSNIAVGEKIDVTVKDKFGYTFEGLRITDSSGNVIVVRGTNFVVSDVNVRIEPIFNPIINPNTGSFISLIAMILFGVLSVFICKYVKKYEPITNI